MNTQTSRTPRTLARMLLGALGIILVTGLVTTASAKVKQMQQNALKAQELRAKPDLPREWRWQRPTLNLDGMIRPR